jgi:hypothetical protein
VHIFVSLFFHAYTFLCVSLVYVIDTGSTGVEGPGPGSNLGDCLSTLRDRDGFPWSVVTPGVCKVLILKGTGPLAQLCTRSCSNKHTHTHWQAPQAYG